MGNARNRLQMRDEAKRRLNDLFRQPAMVNVVHYSCESFYDRTDGKSPRVTSLAVRNLGSGQTVSFSIHQVAERRHLGLGQIEQHYDCLERQMLEEFYAYVQGHQRCKWLHWNMRDINYRFPALEHRFRVLDRQPERIAEGDLVDLAKTLTDIYGDAYAEHPRLETTVKSNKMSAQHFLAGGQEAEAFDNKEYVRLHQSTLKKVDLISNIAERAWDGTLKTNARWHAQYGTTLGGLVEAFTEHWAGKAFSLVGVGATLLGVPSVIPALLNLVKLGG